MKASNYILQAIPIFIPATIGLIRIIIICYNEKTYIGYSPMSSLLF